MTAPTIVPSSQIAHDASEGLFERDPMRSAKYVLSRAQKIIGALVLLVAVVVGVVAPFALLNAFMLIFSLAFLGAVLFKFVVAVTFSMTS